MSFRTTLLQSGPTATGFEVPPEVVAALMERRDHPSALVREHVAWALGKHLSCGTACQGRFGGAFPSVTAG